MLALAAAPAIVRADSLMRVVPIDQLILWGDGIHDDAIALQALIDGCHFKCIGNPDYLLRVQRDDVILPRINDYGGV